MYDLPQYSSTETVANAISFRSAGSIVDCCQFTKIVMC